MARSPVSSVQRPLGAILVLAQLLVGCPPRNPPLAPVVGWVERREPNLVAVPGGVVDVAGGKLLVVRSDFVLDTRLGREMLGAVYDSASGGWWWTFESRYDGALFTDESGASFPVAGLPPGAAVAGTHWVRLDATRMRTKGGLVHEYDAGGRLLARYWSSDPYPRIRQQRAPVAGAPRVTAIEQCTSASACTPLFRFDYDADGRLASIVDRADRRAEFAWDGAGRLVSARDPLDVARGWPGFRYEYVGSLLVAVTSSEGERVRYAYAGRSLVGATQEGPGAPSHRLQYQGRDAGGLYHTRHWNPLDEEERFAYDAEGRLLERLQVESGERTAFAWSGERRTAQTLPNGATTLWTWAGDDVQSRTDASGNVVSFAYQPDAVNRDDPRVRPIASIHDSLGLVEARSYDASGRLLERRNGALEPTAFTWAGGALASESAGGVTKRFSQVGEHGHAERIDAFGATLERSFDAVGNLVQGSDGQGPLAGGIARRGFDEDRNLVSLELDPQGEAFAPETIVLRYRSDGRRLSVERGGDDHVFVYDALGRLAETHERADGDWRVTRFGHDAVGRPTFVARPNGMREEVEWAPTGRPVAVRRLRNGVLESSLAFVYEAGELVRVDDSIHGSEYYAYDAAGRRIATRHANGEELFVQHDPRSRLRAESFVSAGGDVLATLLYDYDLADRRTRIADLSGPLLETSYEQGRVRELRYGNGLVRTFSFGSEGTLVGSSTRDASGALVESTERSSTTVVDASGAALQRQRVATSTHGAVEVMTVEEYDLAPLGGTTSGARVARWSDALGGEQSYAFDARSNLRAAGDASFVYNAEGNRLLGVVHAGGSVAEYAYDAAGFVTSRNGASLAWNAAGRLVAHGSDRFDWDGLGRLREAEVAGVVMRFAFGGRVQADPSGAPLVLDLGEVVVGFDGDRRYRHLDFRGNVKWVSDGSGRVVAHYRYGPFGLDAVFGADVDPVRFVARPEIGELMLLGERVYDPAIGRFLSPDPLLQIVNQYAYTLGNPVWFSDADGRSSEANDAAEGFDDIVGTLGLVGAVLATLAALLRFGPLPHLQMIAAVLGLISVLLGLLVALMLVFGKPRAAPSQASVAAGESPAAGTGTGTGGGGSGGGGGGFDGGGVGGGCSPARLTAVPEARGWLPILIPLQLLLGFLLLRRRRREGPS